MVKDFRQPAAPDARDDRPDPGERAAHGRRIVIRAIQASALLLGAAGLWLLLAGQEIFPPDVTLYLGWALLLVAATDLLLVGVLRRVWARRRGTAD